MGIINKEELRELIKERHLLTADDVFITLREVVEDTLREAIEDETDTEQYYNEQNPFFESFGTALTGNINNETAGLEEQILDLYTKGISIPDIETYLKRLYGIEVSPTLISHVSNRNIPLFREWKSRPLRCMYSALFLDTIHFSVKQQNSYVSRAAYVLVGIDMDGSKDVLGMYIGEKENRKFWLSVMIDLKNRGTEDILICCIGDNTGFLEAVTTCFPRTQIQNCIIYQIRNSVRYVSGKDKEKLVTGLKTVYTAESEEAALAALDGFEKKWGQKYPLVTRSWQGKWGEISTYFKNPVEIRKLIYTANMLESYHSRLKKAVRGNPVFPTNETLLKMLYIITQDVMIKWTKRIGNWDGILLQLSASFPDRVESHPA